MGRKQSVFVVDGKKPCSDCGLDLPVGEFGPNPRGGALGLQPRCMRCSNLRQNYGINRVEYDRLLAEQGGVCAICGEPPEVRPTGRTRTEVATLAVDHDHTTGKVRGLLCADCNRAIGLMRENVDRLTSAIVYLQHHRGGPR